jgi:hypothetical protein
MRSLVSLAILFLAVCVSTLPAHSQTAPTSAPAEIPADVRRHIDALESGDAKAQIAAARELAAMKERATPAASALVAALGKDKVWVQRGMHVYRETPGIMAAAALRAIGAPALDALAKGLESDNAIIRVTIHARPCYQRDQRRVRSSRSTDFPARFRDA